MVAAAFAWDGDLAFAAGPRLGRDPRDRYVRRRRRTAGRPTAATLLEAAVHPARQGRRLEFSAADRRTAIDCAALGFGVACSDRSGQATNHSSRRCRSLTTWRAGVPMDWLADPWLRVHERLGAHFVKIAPMSMTISGTLAGWRDWTGLPFDVSGDVVVPGALVPVHALGRARPRGLRRAERLDAPPAQLAAAEAERVTVEIGEHPEGRMVGRVVEQRRAQRQRAGVLGIHVVDDEVDVGLLRPSSGLASLGFM